MSILVLSPHCDDETLGAGGYLMRANALGEPIHWLNFCDMAVEHGYTAAQVQKRREIISKVSFVYGFSSIKNLNLKPAALEREPMAALSQAVASALKESEATTLIIPWCGDPHTDHKVVYQAGWSASKAFRAPKLKQILACEIISETDYGDNYPAFLPNVFINITDTLEDKCGVFKIYDTEMQTGVHPRTIENITAQAVRRGRQAGMKYAEAYMLLKELI